MCPIESTLARINGKWKLRILKTLSRGAVRYSNIGINIPDVSAKVLTQQLRELERDGLVMRIIYPEIPPRVEYELTDMGRSIFTVFVELRRWGLEEDKVNGPVCKFCGCCRPTRSEAS